VRSAALLGAVIGLRQPNPGVKLAKLRSLPGFVCFIPVFGHIVISTTLAAVWPARVVDSSGDES
jgi:hypothetical protein